MTTDKKPSARFLCANDQGHGFVDYVELGKVLDEMQERLAKLERKTSSTDVVHLDLADKGWTAAVRWREPEPQTREVTTIRTAEEWRTYHGDYPPPPAWFTEAQPVMVVTPANVYEGDGLGRVKGYEPTEDPE